MQVKLKASDQMKSPLKVAKQRASDTIDENAQPGASPQKASP